MGGTTHKLRPSPYLLQVTSRTLFFPVRNYPPHTFRSERTLESHNLTIHQNNNIIILTCHINDCMITRKSQVLIQKYKDELKNKYSLTDLGAANWLLGIKITRDSKAQTISLSQDSISLI